MKRFAIASLFAAISMAYTNDIGTETPLADAARHQAKCDSLGTAQIELHRDNERSERFIAENTPTCLLLKETLKTMSGIADPTYAMNFRLQNGSVIADCEKYILNAKENAELRRLAQLKLEGYKRARKDLNCPVLHKTMPQDQPR